MKLIINDKNIEYTAREIITAYIPRIKLELCDDIPQSEDYACANVLNDGENYIYKAVLCIDGKLLSDEMICAHFAKKHVSKLLGKLLKQIVPVTLPWGLLTGIRPAKMVRELINECMTYSDIYNLFVNEYEVIPQKAELAIEVAKTETLITDQMNKDAVSLYIGIPFCPTRCLYCSFTSQSIKFSNTLVEPYMDALFKEIDYMSDYLKSVNTPIETIYIGGGTPTALDEYNLGRLIDKIENTFDLSHIKEYTVEAGRPDTITEAKLKTLKSASVSRISINPQTMNKKTLEIIGRYHTPDDVLRSYDMAIRCGFDHINTDLIAGLPGETIDDFNNTLSYIEKMNPQSVTVHTLSIKHGSYLDMNYSMYTPTAADNVEKMLQGTDSLMRRLDKSPYYMYRQKNMLGNLENVGYCNKGYECLYNIYIMDEVQSIISLGAGGSTKIVKNNNIERVFNVKEVSEYIKRIDEMIERKNNLLKFGLK